MVLDEIDDFFKTKKNRDNYKSYMTMSQINQRLPYGKAAVFRSCISTFLGTCNESSFLDDPTGTQRFSVFAIQGFDPKVKSLNIELVWAYAYKLYVEGFDPEYSEEELRLNEASNENFKYDTPEYEAILSRLGKVESKDEEGVKFMTTTEVTNFLNSVQKEMLFANWGVGRALTRLGFLRGNKKIAGSSLKGYYFRFHSK